MKQVFLFLIVLALAGPAQSAAWKLCSDDIAKSTIKSGEELCVDFETGDLTSNVLYMGKCSDNFDVVFNADYTGTETTSTVQVLSCVTSSCNANACNPLTSGGAAITLTGAVGSTEIGGAFGAYICIEATTDPVDTDPRVLVKCN